MDRRPPSSRMFRRWCALLLGVSLGLMLPTSVEAVEAGSQWGEKRLEAVATSAAQVEAFFGRPISDISVVYEADYQGEGLEGLLEIPEGARLSSQLLEENLLLLYQLGNIKNIEVKAQASGDAVALTLHILPSPLVAKLRIKGNRLLSEPEIRKLTRLEVGQPYQSSDIKRTIAAIRRAYVEEGYSRAKVKIDREPAPDNGEVVTIRVIEGTPERVASLRFSGVSEAEARRITDATRVRIGDRFVPEAVEGDRRRILQSLKSEGYLAARVEMEPQLFANNRRVIRYSIQKGPIIELDFVLIGARAFGPLRGELYTKMVEVLGTDRRTIRNNQRRELVDLLDLENERQFSTGFVLEARDTLKSHYQKQGYNDVRVLVRDTSEAGSLGKAFQFTIRLGEVIPIEEVVVTGNQAIDSTVFSELFLESMSLSAPWGIYTDKAFKQTPDLLLAYYRGQGYGSAHFESVEVELEVGAFGKRALIYAEVVEGERTTVEDIQIDGIEAELEDTLRRLITLETGQPYNKNKDRQGRDAILGYYQARGYRDATVASRWSAVTQVAVQVVYTVDVGEQHTFGQTLYAGNWQTRDAVIERELDLAPGMDWDPKQIVDVQRNLMATGVFRSVEMRDIVGSDSQDDLLVVLHERSTIETALALGISLEDWLEASVSASNNNVAGLGHRASLNAEIAGMSRSVGVGELLELSQLYARIAASTGSKVNFTYTQPHLMGRPIRSIYSVNLFERDFKTNYRIQRNALSWSLARPIGDGVQSYALLQGERRRPVGGTGIRDCELSKIWDVDGESRYGTTEGAGFVFTTRQSNSAQASRRGFLVAGQAEWTQMYKISGLTEDVCDDAVGSDATFWAGVGDLAEQFTRLTARASWSEPWTPWLRTEVRVNGGYAMALPGSGGAIPVEKRFYLGGATTVRGFLLERLGPVVVDRAAFTGLTGMYTVIPTGGNALMSYSVEMTVPLSVASPSLIGWELGVFHDGGNVYWTGESKDTFLAEVAKASDEFDATDSNSIPGRSEDRCDPIGPLLRTSYGAGLRYQTPVGPLRLDFAKNTAPRCAEPPWQVHFSIGLF